MVNCLLVENAISCESEKKQLLFTREEDLRTLLVSSDEAEFLETRVDKGGLSDWAE